jgi:hypothetical protein
MVFEPGIIDMRWFSFLLSLAENKEVWGQQSRVQRGGGGALDVVTGRNVRKECDFDLCDKRKCRLDILNF